MSDDSAALMLNQKIILFDAQCKLCSVWSNFIIAHDPTIKFKLCSVQSPAGQTLLAQFGFSTTDFTSMIYIEAQKPYTRSQAVFRVFSQLGYPWKLLSVFKLLPRKLTDWLYNKVAKNRYTLFGKYQYCRIPQQKDEEHYL